MQERTCKQCGETKPLETGFHKQAKAVKAGGYRVVCKTCALAYQKAMYQTPEGRERVLRSAKQYYESERGQQKIKERYNRPESEARRKAQYEKQLTKQVQMEGTRVCSKCSVEKPIDDYYKVATGRGGRASECKPCYKQRVTAYKEANSQKYKDYWKAREQNPEYRAQREKRRQGPIQTEGTQVCRTCAVEKPITDFYIHRQKKNKRFSNCKPCQTEYRRKYRKTPSGRENTKKWNDCRDYSRMADFVRNRRARLKGAPGRGVTQEDWQEVLERFGARCYYCGAEDKELTRDHVEPLQRGGAHEPENLLPACVSCNSSKRTRFLLEWVMADPERFGR